MPNSFARPERIAHRGMPRQRIENTLPGFRLAIERGADAIELDTHVTHDGVVIVHHDATIGGRPIAASSWSELEGIELGGDFRIPRLDDVLDAVGDGAMVYIELKGQAIEDAVVEVARSHGRRYALHSFDHDAMVRAAAKAPNVARGILLDEGTPNPIDALRAAVDRIHPRDVWPHWSLANEQFIHEVHRLAARVIVWTVNSPKDAQRLAALGVDGICTDDVGMLAKLS
jgi:glycerophosphoryl diester phosphodiesterase